MFRLPLLPSLEALWIYYKGLKFQTVIEMKMLLPVLMVEVPSSAHFLWIENSHVPQNPSSDTALGIWRKCLHVIFFKKQIFPWRSIWSVLSGSLI